MNIHQKNIIERYLDGKYKGVRANKRRGHLIAHAMADNTTVTHIEQTQGSV